MIIERKQKSYIIKKEIDILTSRLERIEKAYFSLRKENEELRKENEDLRKENKELKNKLRIVLQELSNKKIKRDSHNSHSPPSKDYYSPKNRSLRKKSTRKTGGQKGHKGHTLEMSKFPDEIKKIKSKYCSKCGYELQDRDQELLSRRQVIEIPPIKPIIIEYQQYRCTCQRCGNDQRASYPKEVKAPIQYGASVTSLVSYFNVFQYIPYARLKLLLQDIFALSLSEGTIQNLLNKVADKSSVIYDKILENIKQSTYVGSDETSAKINGSKWWIWVWQNIKNTYISANESRGFKAINQIIGTTLPSATLVSDRWSAQLKMNTKNKQLCIAHLLRDLKYLQEIEKLEWANNFEMLLSKALALRQKAQKSQQAYQREDKRVIDLEQKLNQLLINNIDKGNSAKTHAFQKSMIKNRNHIFTFLYDLEVPPDNNSSERAIRNIKVKQKVSGQFKSGQDTFCIIRSVIDTFRKRNLDVFQNLQLIANFVPE